MGNRHFLFFVVACALSLVVGCSDGSSNGGCSDDDGDGVCLALDVCPTGNDADDADADGVPDACDVCDGQDDTMDTDGDGVPNGCDQCSFGADSVDTDSDGVGDACDVCPAGDDSADDDMDGIPDDCDACAGSDDLSDSDGDGVPDGCDDCMVGSDLLDTDGDDVADACDVCPADNPNDSNGDSVCDSAASFEMAYVSEFTFSTNIAAVGSTGVIINTGVGNLDLSTISVVSSTHDHPTATITPSVGSPAGTVPVGQYAGSLSPLATQLIIDSGLVTEPEAAGASFSLSLSFSGLTASDVRMTTVIEAGGSEIALHRLFHFVAGGSTAFDSVSRVESDRSF